MDQLARVFLKMSASQFYFFSGIKFDRAAPTDRTIKLRDLVAFGKVRIIIIFTVKFDLFRNSVNQRLTSIENYAKDCRDGKDLETDAERRACKDFLDWKVSGTL